MTTQLTVYKASAGSGKTFTLATEYIKLLVENPQAYRTILAVTFTNKATEEMKMRILSQLYGIWKQLPDSKDYQDKITRELGISQQMASQRAGEALQNLLHNYNYFRVETIDSFFQSVLRNLARELDLSPNLRVGLNDVQVMEQAVDELIDELRVSDPLLLWIIDYIKENMEEDKAWNVIGQIKNFGRTLFRDYYKQEDKAIQEAFKDPDFFGRYTRKLQDIKKNARETMTQYAQSFYDALEANNLSVNDLSNKSRGIFSYFKKLEGDDWGTKNCVNTTMIKHQESIEAWLPKKSEHREQRLMAVSEELLPILNSAEQARQQQWSLYVSADVTLRHLNQLRLLGKIEERVNDINKEANRFLLSDTQYFLHQIMGQSDSPFVFEKIGSQLEHIMIDEFQDTSTIQWKNFRVLLEETMSRGGNLIVGDVKQSIYRWRSGDWRLLNGIEEELLGHEVAVEPLKTNYRSQRNIIDFNNRFFLAASEIEYANEQELNPAEACQLRQAYSDVEQEIPLKRQNHGLVQVALLPKQEYEEQMLQRVIDTVDMLKEHGVKEQDICILVRTNKHIPLIADTFMQKRPEINIVSDEAFRLDSSIAVNTLVEALHSLLHPDDELSRKNLMKAYDRINGLDSPDNADETGHPLELPLSSELLSLPLNDLLERLFALFHLEKISEESAYLCAFYDQVGKFLQETGADLESFLQEWEESIHAKTIQSDVADGIRLISIHKSKGLEFNNVIIPFCDWIMEMRQGNTIWCKPQEMPFAQLPLVPIDYSSKLEDSIYKEDYVHEHLQNCVDNLNLLYVAFTRASHNLFVIGKRDAKNSRSQIIQQVLEGWGVTEEEQALPIIYETGELFVGQEMKGNMTQNVFLQPTLAKAVTVRTFDAPVEFRQSNQSRDFVEEDDEASRQRDYIKIGCVLHQLFSTIRTLDDIAPTLRQMELGGMLYNEDVSVQDVARLLGKCQENPVIRDWFSPQWQLFNECSIIRMDERGKLQERRPDRVMTDGKEMLVVDFKFGRPRPEYHEQVMEYMQLLRQMGHEHVRGYLWYVYNNEIEEVK